MEKVKLFSCWHNLGKKTLNKKRLNVGSTSFKNKNPKLGSLFAVPVIKKF
jgi:hypothetical protein